MLDHAVRGARAGPHGAVHLVPRGQERLREIPAVLARDARDQSDGHGIDKNRGPFGKATSHTVAETGGLAHTDEQPLPLERGRPPTCNRPDRREAGFEPRRPRRVLARRRRYDAVAREP